jgi:hypothetical protein
VRVKGYDCQPKVIVVLSVASPHLIAWTRVGGRVVDDLGCVLRLDNVSGEDCAMDKFGSRRNKHGLWADEVQAQADA